MDGGSDKGCRGRIFDGWPSLACLALDRNYNFQISRMGWVTVLEVATSGSSSNSMGGVMQWRGLATAFNCAFNFQLATTKPNKAAPAFNFRQSLSTVESDEAKWQLASMLYQR
jgi:hypothetical protein